MAVPGGVGSHESSGSGTPSSMSERQLDLVRERSSPLTRRQVAKPPRMNTSSSSRSGPQVTSCAQNVLNVGASQAEVIDAQRFAASQAAQAVAARAQILHEQAISEVQGQATEAVQSVFQEASLTVGQLREQLQASEERCAELLALGKTLEQQLVESKADLSRVGAELVASQTAKMELETNFHQLESAFSDCRAQSNALTFQLTQSRVELQAKDRELRRLRLAAPSATEAAKMLSSPSSRVGSSSAQWVHLGSPDTKEVISEDVGPAPVSPTSDPRVDQLIEAVNLLAAKIEPQNAVEVADVAVPPPDGSAAPAPPDGDEARVPDRIRRLRDEAV